MKERLLFAALVVLHLLPLWAVRELPTTDGPCHVYNALILREHANTREYPLFKQYYWIDRRPLPNLTSHLVLAGLMGVVSGATAEKLLASLYVVLFLYGARYLAAATGPERRWLGYLAFPFVFNQTFQFGFYNFCLSLACFLFALGLWWRRRDRPSLGFAVAINLILLVCYFSHIVSTVLALFGIAALWLATLRRANLKRHLLHIPILLPQLVLPLWFIRGGAPASPSRLDFAADLAALTGLRVLFTFSSLQLQLGIGVAVLFGLLILATLRQHGLRWRDEDGFLLLAVALVIVYFVSPDRMAGGSLLKMRLVLYPWLALLPWLTPRPALPVRRWEGLPVRWAVVAALAGVAAVHAGAHVRWYRTVERDAADFLAVTRSIAPNSRVLPLLFNFQRGPSIGVLPLLSHAIDRTAAAKGLIDWGNYEATTTLFPVRFQSWPEHPTMWEVEAEPEKLDLETYRDQIDYVFCWKLPVGSPAAHRLRRRFDLIDQQGDARLYERRSRIRAKTMATVAE